MRYKTILFITALIILLLTTKVNANDFEKEISSSINGEIAYFYNSLPKNVQEFLPDDFINGNLNLLSSESISEKKFIELAVSYISLGIKDVLKSFSSVLVLLIITAIFNTINSSLNSSGLNYAFSICSALCISLTVIQICNTLCTNTSKYINILCNVMNGFIPLMISLLMMNGNFSSAVMVNGSFILFICLVEGFLIAFMMPLVKMCLAFGVIKAIGSRLDFSGISKTVKTVFTSVTIFLMSVFMFVMSFKSSLAQSADTLSLKTARFAISSFVPIVGSSINDTLRTVSFSLSMLKKSCGMIAIALVAVLMLPILINLLLNKFSFSLLASISKLTNGNCESSILDEADSVCGFLLTIVACTCVLFIFALTIFIKCGGNS